MSLLRGNPDINTSVRKATSSVETAPKRKHVRACVVYTWDHHSGREFWNAVKTQPIQNDEVRCFKMLITIHKVLQEGHKSVLIEAQHHANWFRSLARTFHSRDGYGALIDEYVRFLLDKLQFHRNHPLFNGTFEYEEFVSLRTVDDPNDGFESVIDLMNLQDSIENYQQLVFSKLRGRFGNECRISSLTAMVAESYGIYRFATSMLRALHSSALDSGALEPLRQRYNAQHKRLRNFYLDCTTLKYLRSLISIPELPEDPPNLFATDDEAPPLPRRPIERSKTGESLAPTEPPSPVMQPVVTEPDDVVQPAMPEPTGDWWLQQQLFEEQQRQLQQQLFEEQQRQQQQALEQQRLFEAQQAQLMQQQRAAEQEFLRQQEQNRVDGHLAELEQELFMLRNQQEEAQMMLQQYDQRVQFLESELQQNKDLVQQQIDSRDAQIESLQEQVRNWKQKYEALAKLYSQLRQEHLDALAKFKKVQTKAASAQEAIEKREKTERDLKAKNLELADLIRERDRARYELDRMRGQHRDETERLEREISLLNDKLSEAGRSRGQDISALLQAHEKEIRLLEDKLAEKQKTIDQIGDLEEVVKKDDEIDILKETIGSLEDALRDLSVNGSQKSRAAHNSNAVDAVLMAATEQVQTALFDFDAPVGTSGNINTTAAFVLSIVEKATDVVEEFSSSLHEYFADDNADPANVIKYTMLLAGSICDMLVNTNGLTKQLTDEKKVDLIVFPAKDSAVRVCAFYGSLLSDLVSGLELDDKIELVISNHVEVQQALKDLVTGIESTMPRTDLHKLDDIGGVVDHEMEKAASTVAEVNAKLAALLAQPRNPQFNTYDRRINELILSAGIAVTQAVAMLIKAATECQQEIVAVGRGSDSPKTYYKKNHHWANGLISAARAVAGATNVLLETGDGVLSGRSTPEELIVASHEVSATTAQLVASSRVKAPFLSKKQEALETASKTVTTACRGLVDRVQDIMARDQAEQQIDYSALPPHEFKTAAMNQQVEVLKLEQQLNAARGRLFEIRKLEYANQDDE